MVGTGVREGTGVVSLVTKPSVGVTVGVSEAVGTGVLVPARVEKTVGDEITAGAVVLEGAGTGVSVGTGTGVFVTVGSGVFVSVGKGVSVKVGTGVSEAPGTGVSVGPGMGVSLGTGVSVGVGVGVSDGAIWVISMLLLISEVSIAFSVRVQLASTHLEAVAVK